jgi:flavin-dependent dehydrogenase
MVSRKALARWQLERARSAGAVHLSRKVREVRRTRGGWRLVTSDGDVTVSVLVGADGAASLVRRTAAPTFRVELAPTRVAYPIGAGPTPDTVYLRLYAEVAGYLWDFPRADHRSVGIVVPQGTWRRPRLDGEIDGYRIRQEEEVRDAERAGAVIGTAWYGHGDYRCIAGEDFALLGDAAGLADPLTGEGIQNALRSAALLARAWKDGGLDAYPALARESFEREFRVTRLLRHHLHETGRGVRIVEWGRSSRLSYAFVAACVNALNDRQGVGGLVTRWVRRTVSPGRRGAPV